MAKSKSIRFRRTANSPPEQQPSGSDVPMLVCMGIFLLNGPADLVEGRCPARGVFVTGRHWGDSWRDLSFVSHIFN